MNGLEYSVRLGREEDAEGLVRAHEAGWDAALAPMVGKSLGDLAPFEARVERAREGLANAPENVRAWVAECDGEIVGMAITMANELRDLYVVPTAWGTGVAAGLMDAALEHLRARQADEAVLWVGEANSRARRFYEREGWAPDGKTRKSTLGPREVRYRLDLAAS
jgi:GNAT superfamily N-acetyltransferase